MYSMPRTVVPRVVGPPGLSPDVLGLEYEIPSCLKVPNEHLSSSGIPGALFPMTFAVLVSLARGRSATYLVVLSSAVTDFPLPRPATTTEHSGHHHPAQRSDPC